MITGDDFLTIASKWVVLPNAGETAWRTSISRAYYGAYHLGLSLIVETLGITDTIKGNEHVFVQLALIASKNSDAGQAGSKLGTLHKRRQGADYEIRDDDKGTHPVAIETFRLAEQIRDHIKAAAAPANHAAMRANIIAWRNIKRM